MMFSLYSIKQKYEGPRPNTKDKNKSSPWFRKKFLVDTLILYLAMDYFLTLISAHVW